MFPAIVVSVIAAFSYGRIRRRLSVRGVFVLGLSIMAVAMGMLGATRSYVVILIAQLGAGVAIGLLSPNVSANAASADPESDRLRSLGFSNGSTAAGSPAAQLLLDPVAQSSSAGVAIWFVGILAAGAGLWMFLQKLVGGAVVSARRPS